jgi:hypothetical protein
MPSPVFRFNEQLLVLMTYEGGRNVDPRKRVFVNSIEDGLAFHTMARFHEVTIRLIESGIARVIYTDNAARDAVIVHKDYDRKDIQEIAEDIVGYLEDRFDPAATEEVV